MPTVSDDAIVLRHYEYSENSQILVFLTLEHGRIRTIAKGIKKGTRKRFAPAVDLLDAGNVSFYPRRGGEGLSTLGEWKQTRAFPGLRTRLDRLHGALYCAESAAKCVEDLDPHPVVFAGLLAALVALESSDAPIVPALSFLCLLLRDIGLWPRLDACRNCGRKDDLAYFEPRESGVLCRHCEAAFPHKQPMSQGVREALESFWVVPDIVQSWDQLSANAGARPNAAANAFRILDEYLSHVTGRASELSAKLLNSRASRV